jgi:glycosyltransferase involved in cell wall biosynthesis
MSFGMCVNTQTPLVRFNPAYDEKAAPDGPVILSEMMEDRDYQFSPGGVTRMVLPLLKRMLQENLIKRPCWVSLSPVGPEEVLVDGIRLSHVRMGKKALRGYGHIKEDIWRVIHGIKGKKETIARPFWEKDYADFAYYNRFSAERIALLDKEMDFDIFYIHDFQQLPVGHMLGSLKPKLFRWHIPFDESIVPADWKPFLLTYFNAYDMVMVSCRKYLDALRSFGFKGNVRYVYPYIDQTVYGRPAKNELDAFCAKFGIRDRDRVLLVVARMDPMKGQDGAIEAFARVAKTIPDLKLVLAGNGSFSSSKQGVGLSKAARWQDRLSGLARRLKVQDRVVFTGHIDHRELQAAYERCELTLLPSRLEGFGLVVIESWLYRKPAIVSSKAGVADIIVEGQNGLLFDPGDIDGLAGKIVTLLKDPETGARLGKAGYDSSKKCTLEEGLKQESEILECLISGQSRSDGRHAL